jgi:hypothetical protein
MNAKGLLKKAALAAAAAIALAGCRIDLPSLSGQLNPTSKWVTGVVSDFITGGGWFLAQNGSYGPLGSEAGAQANFGWHGGVKNGDWWGNGTYIDHAIGLHVTSNTVTGYERLGQDSSDGQGHPIGGRQTCGWADTDLYGQVRYLVMEIDNGEPGRTDRFGIALYYPGWSVAFYAVMGSLGDPTPGGGNIQLHNGNNSNVPPNQPADCPANPFPE